MNTENQSAKVSGAKNALNNMLYCYMVSLAEEGEPDPKQKVTTDVAQMINTSEAQLEYLKLVTKNDILVENLKTCISLLQGMSKSKKLDYEAINIVVKILELIKDSVLDIKLDAKIED